VVHLPTDDEIFRREQSQLHGQPPVDNLDALLKDLKKSGIGIDPHREDYDYGRFAWITDADGNRIELREPPKPKKD
jgi:predicted enzyme related to lactoylglutathione lyase